MSSTVFSSDGYKEFGDNRAVIVDERNENLMYSMMYNRWHPRGDRNQTMWFQTPELFCPFGAQPKMSGAENSWEIQLSLPKSENNVLEKFVKEIEKKGESYFRYRWMKQKRDDNSVQFCSAIKKGSGPFPSTFKIGINTSRVGVYDDPKNDFKDDVVDMKELLQRTKGVYVTAIVYVGRAWNFDGRIGVTFKAEQLKIVRKPQQRSANNFRK